MNKYTPTTYATQNTYIVIDYLLRLANFLDANNRFIFLSSFLGLKLRQDARQIAFFKLLHLQIL